MRQCNVCKQLLPFENFGKRKAGFQYTCKSCNKSRLKQANDLKMSTFEGHIKTILLKIKSRAKARGIPFTLDLDYLVSIAPKTCPVLDVELNWCFRSSKPTANSPSIDRLNPNLGYVRGNVAWLSYRANRIKNDASLAELKKLINWIEQF